MTDAQSLSDFTADGIDGTEVDLSTYQDKLVLVVNTASQCGFTPQYAGLQELQETYGDRGFTVLGFPCDQFGHQEPGENGEIAQFCESSFGVTFPMFAKINGTIKWNFTKFLIGADGQPVERFAPTVAPAEIAPTIEKLLET